MSFLLDVRLNTHFYKLTIVLNDYELLFIRKKNFGNYREEKLLVMLIKLDYYAIYIIGLLQYLKRC